MAEKFEFNDEQNEKFQFDDDQNKRFQFNDDEEIETNGNFHRFAPLNDFIMGAAAFLDKQKAPPPGERFLCYLVDPFHQAMDPLDEEEEDEPKDNRD